MQPKSFKQKTLAERLGELMTDLRLTQQSLADQLGVSQTTVSNWLRGSIPNGAELYRLAKFFNVTMEWMIEGSAGEGQQPKETGHLRSLSPAQMVNVKAIRAEIDAVQAKLDRIIHAGIAHGVDPLVMAEAAEPFPVSGKRVILQENKTAGGALTCVSEKRKSEGVTEMQQLIRDVAQLSRAKGKKAEVAAFVGVDQPRISEWLAGKYEPGGQNTILLQQWVKQEKESKKS